jgi:hypothetical protein
MIGLRHLTLRVPDAEALDGLHQTPRSAEGIPIEIKTFIFRPMDVKKFTETGRRRA